jgi:hypothetical protein
MANWHVIAVDGSERELRAFVSGLLAARNADPSAIVFGDDVGLEGGSLGDRMRGLLHGGHHATLAPDPLADALADALAQGGAALGLRVTDRRPVTRATFEMHAEVYSRDVSAQLRAALRGAPMSQHSESEQAHAEDKGGVDLYAPVHTYTYRVRATVNGPVGEVLAVRRRLADVEAAQIEPLHLA